MPNTWLLVLLMELFCVEKCIMDIIPAEDNSVPQTAGQTARTMNGVDVLNQATFLEMDCRSRWSCTRYMFNRNSVRGYYRDKNCACDELCLLFKDCCPDYQPPSGSSLSTSRATADMTEISSRQRGGDGQSLARQSLEASAGNSRNLDPPRRTSSGQDTWYLSDKRKSGTGTDGEAPDLYARYHLAASMFTCLYDPAVSEHNSVAMVTACPEDWQNEVVSELCHNVTVTEDDLMQRLPVSGTVTRVLYRNMYCAICHQEPFVYWSIGMNCSSHDELPFHENSSFADVMTSKNCSLHFQSPQSQFRWRPCLNNDIEISNECSDTFPLDTQQNREIAARCSADGAVSRMVYGYTRAYRNQFCALCNHENNTFLTCGPLDVGTAVFGPFSQVDMGTRRKLPYSFSILLDINTQTGSSTVGLKHVQRTVQRNHTLTCDLGHVYDPFKDVCRPVTCGPGRHFRDSKCVVASDYLDIERSLDRLDCPVMVELNNTEFRLYEDGTLERLGVNVFYNMSQYSLTVSGAIICVNYSQNYSRQSQEDVVEMTYTFSVAEAVISTCGICVSLLAMAVTIAVYSCLRPLRNIPGQNLLSLVTALFLADLLLLLAPSAGDVPVACAAVAGIMHYLFLAAFVWMNVMALDVWFTFSKAFVKAGDRGKSSKRFLMYSAYAWLAPAVLVIPAVLIQIVQPDSPVSPGYGTGICWLSNKYALLLFFASPLFLLLLLNAVFFLISARNIARARRTSARMLGKEEDGKMAIYVKLTVVMGMTWVFGFLAAIVPNQFLTYSFVVMNTLQGLFIFLSFVLNKRVLSLLKDKFRRRRVKVTKSGSTDQTNLSKSGSSANRKLSSASAKLSHNLVV